ncbi:alpha/beta hydrolase family protein [Sandaracinus amylolyticus]|uniref:alpha/beta hydrolase family protein n=1 Tax=Sandaracinus amylolyticus TaxID=927083 RepID=UPI001F408275|nr:alpha/beta fold hydrolase [Sandaracinus amylolyticus]UJR82173.1 Dipeptidyl aminopeptidases/acylaminoacyl-peptidases-like protein [Sandaracinus amylolyticus]
MDHETFAHEPPPARIPVVGVAITALVTGALGAVAGASAGAMVAVLGGVIGAALGTAGAVAFTTGRRWLGGGVIALGLVSNVCCATGGVVYQGVRSIVPDVVALEPIATADHAYLRHPTLGFLVGAPTEDFEDGSSSPAVRVMAISLRPAGMPEGVWAWTSRETGAMILVAALRASAEPTEASATAFIHAFLRGAITADRTLDPTFVSWSDEDHDVWARAAGSNAYGPVAMSARYRAWRDDAGQWHALFVAMKTHPDDDAMPYLLEVHTPNEPWRGPGAPPPGFAPRTTSLAAARASFTSTPLRGPRNPVPLAPLPDDDAFEVSRYESPVGSLAAYLTRNARERERRPAVLWLHGGYAMDDGDLDPEWGPRALAEAGFVVMLPATRGEHGSDGQIEMFLGEVDDVRAALEHLRALPAVDPERVVVMGHSVGGTLATLLAESGAPARAYFAFGPCADAHWMNAWGPDDQGWVYDPRRVEESWVRSPIAFLAGITSPTFVVEGANESQALAARAIAAAAPPGAPIQVIVPSGGDHQSLVRPVVDLLIPRLRSSEPITLSAAEVEAIAAAP